MNRSADTRRLTTAAVALAVFAFTLWAPQVFNDSDSWWHVAAGRLMIVRGAVLTTDPFSWTMAGQPWFTQEWLSEVLMGGVFNLAGWSGVALLTALAAGASAGLLARHTGRWIGGLPQVLVLVVALSLLAPHLLARPHVLSWPLLELWAAELVIARSDDRAPRWRMLPVMALWANLHGSFLFGLALIAPFALEALIAAAPERRRGVVLGWGGFGVAAGAMALLTPHGFEELIFPFRLMGMHNLSSIGEWAPADFRHVSPLMIALVATVPFLVLRQVKVPPIRAALLLGLLALAIQHNRQEQLLAFVGALVLAAPVGQALAEAAPSAPRFKAWWVEAGAAAVALALAGARLATPCVWNDGPMTPVHALAAVPAGLREAPVLNDFAFGGYLIGNGVRPYIDSRSDLYGDARLSVYGRLAQGDGAELKSALDDPRIQWTLLKTGSPMARAMDAMPGWRRTYADPVAVIHVRATDKK
jgi:hypothetical protein